MNPFEEAISATVLDYPDKYDLADFANMRKGDMINRANPDNEAQVFNVRQYRRILQRTGDVKSLQVLCQDMGGQFIKGGEASEDISTDILRVTAEMGDVVRVAERSLADNRITRSERREINKELDDVEQLINRIRAAVNQSDDLKAV